MDAIPKHSSRKFDFSATGRTRVVVAAILATLACIGFSISLTAFGIVPIDGSRLGQQLVVNIVAPILVAFPSVYFLMSKLRELAIAHRRLTVYASTDALTQIMNRAAFSTLVEAYLTEIRRHDDAIAGALLVIDADNFKSINDKFGHDHGDEALVAIAHAIRSMLRTPDIVGRLGGEEFGVFLPGASAVQAEGVAERIRQSVNIAAFSPAGTPHRLSVSVGGAAFTRRLPFHELFRLADQQLYVAKRGGRNRVAVASVPVDNALAAA